MSITISERASKGSARKHFGLALNLKDGTHIIERYKAYHRDVWPEVEQGLKVVGITEMKIFLLPGRRMFIYMQTGDGFNPDRDSLRYLEHHLRCKQWENLMNTLQEKIPEAKENEWWARMEQVYDLT